MSPYICVWIGNGAYPDCPMTIDATDATFSGYVSSNDNASWDPHAGYTGNGHTGFWGDGGKVEWNVQMSEAETTRIRFRYAAAVQYINTHSTAPLTLEVNGAVIQSAYEFPASGSWTDWQDSPTFKVSLIAGQNTISLENKSGLVGIGAPNIDNL
jgi:hypothetical protein